MRAPRSWVVAVVAMLVIASACTADGSGPGAVESDPAGPGAEPAGLAAPQEPLGQCDETVEQSCLLPFPNDFFTVADGGTDTGRRVQIDRQATPANAGGVHVDTTELNRNDGFSPGSPLLTLVPGVDLEASRVPPITDMEASLAPDASVVLLDATTGERWPYWAELDARPEEDQDRVLFIRPARNFPEGHRMVVALRDLVDSAGRTLLPTEEFQTYRDNQPSDDPAVEARRPYFEQVFTDLEGAGVERPLLVQAWDFTVMSQASLSERLLHLRDDGFAQLGDAAPGFTVDEVEEGEGDGPVLRTVKGTFEVPRYLTGDGGPGAVLNNGDGPGSDPLPEANGTQEANFTCVIPASADAPGADKAALTSLSLYGHGLLGSAGEVESVAPIFQSSADAMFCATDWIGMSSADIPVAVGILQDLSEFRTLADRLQQSILNFLFLGRLMQHPDGLRSDPAFQGSSGEAILGDELVFVGNSQGGILGGAATAVAQDWTRAVLGVPAMNYSTLLDRSVDFDQFRSVYEPAYPDRVERVIGVELVQQLWDRGENNGYAHHLTADPYPDTPTHDVLLIEAFGDHQVTNVATEVFARTIDARLRTPGLAEGRSPDVEPFWEIEPIDGFPFEGSALVMTDFGTPPPPTVNLANRAGDDPHSKPATPETIREAASGFLLRGQLVDPCPPDEPCVFG